MNSPPKADNVEYEAEQDPLCYPGTSVLINSAGLRDQTELDDFEFVMYVSRAEEPLPAGLLDYHHYRAIHRHLFQDVYAWAGEPRRIRIGKGGNWFCYPEHIEREATKLLGWLSEKHYLADLAAVDFAPLAAEFLAELNAIHPFREGNGRTQLVFLNLLASNAGLSFDATKLVPEETLDAMIRSFQGDLTVLTRMIGAMVK